MRDMRSVTRRRRRGQSLVELSLVLPLLLLMLLTGYDVAALVSDDINADNAVRQGARLAAQIGGAQSNPGGEPAITVTVDDKIIQNVLAAATSMPYATFTEIDIYGPGTAGGDPANGSMTAGDKVDKYDGSATPIGSPTFTLDLRNQSVPNESSIGIRLVWTYKPPFGPTMTITNWAVMKAAPIQT